MKKTLLTEAELDALAEVESWGGKLGTDQLDAEMYRRRRNSYQRCGMVCACAVPVLPFTLALYWCGVVPRIVATLALTLAIALIGVTLYWRWMPVRRWPAVSDPSYVPGQMKQPSAPARRKGHLEDLPYHELKAQADMWTYLKNRPRR